MVVRSAKVRTACLLLPLFQLSPSGGSAGILDDIRSQDLNDYAVGGSIFVSQSEYLGSDGSNIVFPFLTSFRHHAFHDDWLVVNDGNLGIRHVRPDEWQFGLLTRIRTRGFGANANPELRGLRERQWTVETGGMLGYRGLPVHIEGRLYTEITGRHSGLTGSMILSYPRQYSWGYIVPMFKWIWQDTSYNDYYYGVDETEARPGRPVYETDGDVGWRAKLRVGYKLTPTWLLLAGISYERLSDAVRGSPIVARDGLWSWDVGIAYNADVFRPRDTGVDTVYDRRFEFRAGVYFNTVDSQIERDGSDGQEAGPVDLDDLLGQSDSQSFGEFEVVYYPGHYHRLEAAYFEFGRSSTTTLDEEVRFGDIVLDAGETVSTSSEFSTLRLGYAYALTRDEQKQLAVSGGVHYTTAKVRFETADNEVEEADLATLMPVIGVDASIMVSRAWRLGARVQAMRTEFNRYDGWMAYVRLDLERRFRNGMLVGAAFNFYAMRLSSGRDELNGSLRLQHYGPAVYAGVRF